MSLRAAVPEPVRSVARKTYVGLGAFTASNRPLPDFILVGGQRCGTTSLFRALEQHAQIRRPALNKGINYFDLNYHRGERWYRAHFPRGNKLGERRGNERLTFEASGYYMFHPWAPRRIGTDLPRVKIVAMLREPIERAYSAWKHETARGYETLPFEEAIAKEEQRTSDERTRMACDPEYQSHAYRHFSYAARGDYVPQLREFYSRIPRERIHIIYSEDFFRNPEEEFARFSRFLGIEPDPGLQFEQHNARPSGPMPDVSRNLLAERYKDQCEELMELTGRRPPWAQAGGPSCTTV